MSELDLPKCPICHAPDSLFRQSAEMQDRSFIWYECHECESILLSIGNERWAYQRIEKEDKLHLLKQAMTHSELQALVPRAKNGVPEAQTTASSSTSEGPEIVDSGMQDTRACPYCAEQIDLATTVCRYCDRDVTKSPVPLTDAVISEAKPKRDRFRTIAMIAFAVLALVVALKVGFYTVQPIGALPEGKTLIIWRDSGEPFFNSPDAVCLQRQGGVSLLCRGLAFAQAPVDRIILRLPYMKWAYLLSTGGRQFER
jgi:hypothetical protein